MSYSFRLKSHPNRLLKDHLKAVGELAKDIVLSKKIEFDVKSLSKLAQIIGISHDFGKSTTFFQRKLEADERTENAQHAFVSSLFGYFLTDKIFKSNKKYPIYAWIVISRHHGNIQDLDTYEVERLKDTHNKEIVSNQIKNIVENSLDEVSIIYDELINQIVDNIDFNPKEIVKEFAKEINENYETLIRKIESGIRNLVKEENIDNYFLIMFLYSVLLDSDKLDGCGYSRIPRLSKGEMVQLSSNLVKDYLSRKKFENNEINRLRRLAFEDVEQNLEEVDLENKRILSINLPTGLGKTLIGFFVALRIKEKVSDMFKFSPRIIYSLPFLSIIDQNSKVIEEVLGIKFKKIDSRIFIQHHHLSELVYKEKRDDEYESLDPSKSLILIEGWHSEIIITTFIQFFHSLITNKNAAARKFHNIANSIIILDEIQSIPTKYWKMLSFLLENLCIKFNCWIILMTATQPLIFSSEKVKNLVGDPKKFFDSVDRYDISFASFSKNEDKGEDFTTIEDFKKKLAEDILNSDDDLMIICNTIGSCVSLYDSMKSYIKNKYGDGKLDEEKGYVKFNSDSKKPLIIINLSTLVIPLHRLKRIETIKNEKSFRKIIFTTQLVEAGVDISVDKIYRDFAPLDCIIQSAGRCNRNFDSKKGKIIVIKLKDDRGEIFYRKIYDPTILEATNSCTFESNIVVTTEKEFSFSIQNNYYNQLKNKVAQQDLSNYLKRLNFSSLSEFKLIENDEPSLDIVIEIDENVINLLEKIQNLIKDLRKGTGEKFKILAEIEKEKRKLGSYVISIPFYKLSFSELNLEEAFTNSKTFRKVTKEILTEYYDFETGYKITKIQANII
jgi:CRISPR-associated endonuclease/helicase Cas3